MDLTNLAEALGVAKDTPAEKILAEAAKAVANGISAKQSFEKLSKAIGESGQKLAADGKLVRVEPLKLDILESDSDEVKALKAELAAKRLADQIAGVKGRKEIVAKLCKDMALPPAMLELADEVFGIQGELETVMLSKDGSGIELRKSDKFPEKLEKLMRAVVNLKGSKLSTNGPEVDDKAERERLAKSVVASVEGKPAA